MSNLETRTRHHLQVTEKTIEDANRLLQGRRYRFALHYALEALSSFESADPDVASFDPRLQGRYDALKQQVYGRYVAIALDYAQHALHFRRGNLQAIADRLEEASRRLRTLPHYAALVNFELNGEQERLLGAVEERKQTVAARLSRKQRKP